MKLNTFSLFIVQVVLVSMAVLILLPSSIAPGCSFSGTCSGSINVLCPSSSCYSAGSCGTCYVVDTTMGSVQNHCYVVGGTTCEYSCTEAPFGTFCAVSCPNADSCDGSGYTLNPYQSSSQHGSTPSVCGFNDGICSDSICGTVSETCDASLECQVSLGCAGNLICHRDLRKFAPHLTWTTKNATADVTSKNETAYSFGDLNLNGINDACEDGYDNDCDGLVDCADTDCCPLVPAVAPTSPMLNITIAGQDLFWLGSNGILWLKGTLQQNQGSIIPSGSDDFFVKSDSGLTIAMVEGTPGASQGTLYLKGSLFDNQGTLAYPAGGNNLIIRNATAIIAYVNNNGDLYLVGKAFQSKIP
jgi:hypothetical protein